MSKRELANSYVSAYLKKEIDRRAFIKLMTGLGISVVAASAYAAAFGANEAQAARPIGKPPKGPLSHV